MCLSMRIFFLKPIQPTLRDEFKLWCNSNVDFLDSRMNAFSTLAVMHELTQCVVGHMKRLHGKKLTGQVLLQALKHCVAWFY